MSPPPPGRRHLPIAVALLAATGCRSATFHIGRGAALEVTDTGQVAGLRLGGAQVKPRGAGGFSFVEVGRDGAAGRPEPLLGRLRAAAGGTSVLECRSREAELTLRAELSPVGEALTVRGELENLRPGRDRAIRLDFVVPGDFRGWTYETGIGSGEEIEEGREYPGARDAFLTFGDAGKPALLRTSKLWFHAVRRGARGLAVGVAPAAPAAFRLGCDARGMFLRYHLGLTPLTRKFPNRARFAFVVYGIDGRWGIRSAAERFYELFPGAFARRAKQFGSWAGTYDITRSELPDKQDFHITYGDNDFQWRDGEYPPGEGRKLRALGVTVFHWREPWSYFLTGSQPSRSPQEELRLLQQQASGRAGGKTHSQMCGAPLAEAARGVLNSYMTDAGGRLLRVRFQYGCRFIAVNMDPELPRPNRATLAADYQYRWLARWSDPNFDGPRNLAWDSATRWTGIDLLNYRREQFATADYPLTYDPRDGRVCQMKVLADREFAAWHSGKVRQAAGLVMVNSGWQSLLFFGDCMDVPVLERSAPEGPGWRRTCGLYRMLICRKPLSFYRKITPAGIRSCLLFALAPGGDCKHEEYRALTRKYMPAIRAAARAGWEPVTHAVGENCHVERFGRGAPELYFTVVAHKLAKPSLARVLLDYRALGIDPDRVGIAELIEGRRLFRAVPGDVLVVSFEVGPEEALCLQVR